MIRNPTGIGGLLGLLLLCSGTIAQESGTLLPVIPPGTGERCVEPTDVMRREHMQFLMHQRDATVYAGIRGARHSLVGCIDCHAQTDAQGAAIPVDAEGQFCESCHGFTGVSLDCFECHASVPASDRARTELPQWMSSPAVPIAKASSSGVD